MKKRRVFSHLQLSILLSISLFLVTLTFKSYFYYTPFSSGVSLLSILQFLTLCGWISLVAAPPLFLSSEFKWTTLKYWGFLFCVTLWTVSTLIIKLNTLISIGTINYQYLTTFPILIYFEWLVPALYVYIAMNFYKPSPKPKPARTLNRVRFEDEDEDEFASPVKVKTRERLDD